MSRSAISGLVLVVLLSGFAEKDPAYESAMKKWADDSCDCARLGAKDQTACYGSVNAAEPHAPRSVFDNMRTNPNIEISSRYEALALSCAKAGGD